MTEDTTQTPEPVEPNAEPETPDLGDGGRKALDTERQARKQAERDARETRDKLAAMEAAELRRKVATEKNLTPEQAAFLNGDDEEAMSARADELLAAFKADDTGDTPRRPRERLRSGAAPMTEPKDTGAIADEVMKG